MKYVFKPAPNYRVKDKTERIMRELSLGLLVILGFAFYNASTFSSANVTQLVLLTVSALVTAVVTEGLYAVITKQNVKNFITSSFPWIPALILVLISPMNTSVYAIVICTFIGIAFGKLVFGGFGHNIFNPAGVGRAVLFASFMGSVATDVVTGATPTASMASLGWATSVESFEILIGNFGGFQGLLIGNHAGAIGETSALLIMVVGLFLAIRKVIDWRVPAVFLGTIFCGASLIAVVQGMGLWYPVFHLLTGGAMFGAFFMLTDPVTNPMTRVGRIVFAMGCGFITLVIRVMGNLPEGVVYSILIMNMLTPAIDRLFDGQQFNMKIKHLVVVGTVASLGFVTIFASAFSLEAKEMPSESSYNPGPKISLADDLSSSTATVQSVDGNNYLVKSYGFAGENEIEVEIVDHAVVSVKFIKFADTVGIGDLAENPAFLKAFAGASDEQFSIDSVSTATITSKAVAAAVKAALEEAK